jgi:hypothetical protein
MKMSYLKLYTKIVEFQTKGHWGNQRKKIDHLTLKKISYSDMHFQKQEFSKAERQWYFYCLSSKYKEKVILILNKFFKLLVVKEV